MNGSNLHHFILHLRRVLQGREIYLSPLSHPGYLHRSPMILKQFFKDCEQATVPMRPILFSLQKITLVISGAPLPCHQMFSKPAIRLFMHFVSSLTCLVRFLFSDRRFDSELSRLVKASTTRTGAETQRCPSERSRAQDGPPPLQTLAYRRKSDSSSAVSSTSASFLSSTHDGVSLSDPSPVLPPTPQTSTPLSREPPSPPHDLHRPSLKEPSGNNRTSIPSHTYTSAPRSAHLCDRDRIQAFGHHRGPSSPQLHRTEASPLSGHGPTELWDKYGTNYSSSYPVRPW